MALFHEYYQGSHNDSGVVSLETYEEYVENVRDSTGSHVSHSTNKNIYKN